MTPLLRETASQTAGPYVHIGLAPKAAGFDIFDNDFGPVLVTPETQGERITIEGQVFDGSGTPLRDVLLEIWQANAADPVLGLVEWEVRRRTLVGKREQRDGRTVYRFDIHLQGDDETVFFDA